jgi:diaminopimelate decarboxylase
MTDIDMPATPQRHRLPVSMRAIRRLLPLAGCGLPAAVLSDPSVAAWVRAHGVTVYAGDGDELGLAGRCGVRPGQVVLRCGRTAEAIVDALDLGVNRFVVSCERDVDVLMACAHHDTYIHVDDECPAVVGQGCLDVIGLHCDVGGSGPLDWGAAAERLLGRIAQLRTDGSALTRISLTGGPMAVWMQGDKAELKAIAAAVDDAIDEGCARWRLPRPSVTFAPSVSGR